jgi:hypothetical protein
MGLWALLRAIPTAVLLLNSEISGTEGLFSASYNYNMMEYRSFIES